MQAFYSDVEEHKGEAEFADDFVSQTLEDWINAGNSPATLLNAMVKIITEIQEKAALPMQ